MVFELAHLNYQAKSWANCAKRARAFLTLFPEHELSPFAWRYLITSSVEIGTQTPELKEKLIADLETFLKQPLPDAERNEWQLLLAKIHYESGQYEKAMSDLGTLQTPNAHLLAALCCYETDRDVQQFCQSGEKALSEGADLIAPGELHLLLFNAYLELSLLDQGAEHLYAAFALKADVKIENLLWLADVYFNRLQEEEGNFSLASSLAAILDQCRKSPSNNYRESVICKLAKVYSILGRTDEAIALLQTAPSPNNEMRLLLAESYAKKGIVEKATELFDSIVLSSATVRSPVSASASLQGARLKLQGPSPNLTQIATQLKTLTIQKNFEGEPLYLEAGP